MKIEEDKRRKINNAKKYNDEKVNEEERVK